MNSNLTIFISSVCTSVHVEVKGQLAELRSFLLPCRFWGSKLRLSGLGVSAFTLGAILPAHVCHVGWVIF